MLPDNVIGGGGAKINGIIKKYIALRDKTINAGDFVEHSIELPDGAVDTVISNSTYSGMNVKKAVPLSENRILVLYVQGTNSSNIDYGPLYGVIVTINDTEISLGTRLQIGNTGRQGRADIDAVLLSNDRAFLLYNGDSSNYYLNGMVVTIDGTTIIPGVDTRITTVTNGHKAQAVLLSDGKVFIAHSEYYSSTYQRALCCALLTIDGTTISVVKAQAGLLPTSTIPYGGDGGLYLKALDNERVLVVLGLTNYFNAYVITISGTTFSKGNGVSVGSVNAEAGYNIGIALLSNNKAVVIYNSKINSSVFSKLFGVVLTIDGVTIKKHEETMLSGDVTWAQSPISAALLPDSSVFVMLSEQTYHGEVAGIVLTIDGEEIYTSNKTTLLTLPTGGTSGPRFERSVVSIPSEFAGRVFMIYVYGASWHLHGVIADVGTIRAQSRGQTLLGITKSKPANDYVDVYAPG